MISEKMQEAINKQINAEMYSAYLYLSMSAWCSDQNLDGFAQWLKVQAQEEMAHAMKFYGYVHEQQGRVKLLPIEGPPTEFSSVKEVAGMQLDHEKKVTSLIKGLVNLAREEKDFATEYFLQWFVTEQVEEEANAEEIISKLGMIGESGQALYMLDKEMGQRRAGGE